MRDKWTVVAKEDGIRSREGMMKRYCILWYHVEWGERDWKIRRRREEERGEEKSKEDNTGENRGWKMR